MADEMKQKYRISGSGVLCIEGDTISILVQDRGEFNLASVLADLHDKPVKFNFAYDEDYEEPAIKVNPETGEVI